MNIENTRFGNIEIDESKIINMPVSMLGFPGINRYILLEREESKPFLWYQCIDEPSLAFVLMNPFLFKPDYSIDLHEVISEMSWEEVDVNEHITLLVIVNTSHGEAEKFTANLMAPLIINSQKFEAFQKVFHESSYSHEHPIFQSDN